MPMVIPRRSDSGLGTPMGGRFTVVASSGSGPLITLSTRAASLTVRPKTDMQSAAEPIDNCGIVGGEISLEDPGPAGRCLFNRDDVVLERQRHAGERTWHRHS